MSVETLVLEVIRSGGVGQMLISIALVILAMQIKRLREIVEPLPPTVDELMGRVASLEETRRQSELRA